MPSSVFLYAYVPSVYLLCLGICSNILLFLLGVCFPITELIPLEILDTSLLSDTCSGKIFSHTMDFSFQSFIIIFYRVEVFNTSFNKIQLINFFIHGSWFGIMSKNALTNLGSPKFSLFSSRSFKFCILHLGLQSILS